MAHKLLVADDSITIQRVIELTFADEDVEVTAVGDGQLAIDRLDTDPPDIILADVDMPKRDGYEVAAYVKSRPTLAHIPVVLLTGAFEPIDQARAAAAGSSDVLAKPFEPQMVINRVKELLGRKRPDEVAYAPPEADLSRGTEPQMGDPQPAGREMAGDNPQSVSLDDYFDQLDAAFSNLQPGAPPSDGSDEVDWPVDLVTAPAVKPSPVAVMKPVPPAPVAEAPAVAAAPPAVAAEQATTFKPDAPDPAVNMQFAPEPPVAPVVPPPAVASPTFAADAAAAGKPFTSVSTNAPAAPIAPGAADASVPSTPAPSVPVKPVVNPFANLSAAKAEAAARPVVISDEVIEQIVSRVLNRMTDNVVRETVTDIVSQTAERLVQEEIERIKVGG